VRVVYKILLGLFLFNAVFALTSPIFNTGYGADAKGVDDSDVALFDISSMDAGSFLSYIFTHWDLLTALGIISVAGGVLLTFATKNLVFIGVGVFVGVLTGMYSMFLSFISQLGAAQHSVYVTGIISIVSASIGILLLIAVVDMFAPSSATE